MGTAGFLTRVALFGVVTFLGCDRSGAWPEKEPPDTLHPASAIARRGGEDSCRPTFLKVTDKPLEVGSGHWKFGFDAFLVGCGVDLSQVTIRDRTRIAGHLSGLVKEQGLAFFAGNQSKLIREKLVEHLNGLLGRQVLGDLLIIPRYSIEHEPVLDSQWETPARRRSPTDREVPCPPSLSATA